MVEHPLTVLWVVRLIPNGEPIELCCGMCYPVCAMVHVKITLAANWKE